MSNRPLIVQVIVYKNRKDFENKNSPLRRYVINHDLALSRKVLGEQCRNAFEAGQVIVTYPID